MAENKVFIIGIGPGKTEYLTLKADSLIRQADVLIGGQRALNLFADLGQTKIAIKADLLKVKKYIMANYQQKKIAVLVSGDPGFYSIANYLKRELGSDLFTIIPGISSFQLAAARLKIDWAGLKIISLHGKDNRSRLLNALPEQLPIALLTDQKNSADQLAKFLLESGYPDLYCYVLENLSYPDERIISGSLNRIASQSFADLTIVVLAKTKLVFEND